MTASQANERESRLAMILMDVLQRRHQGEVLPDEQVIAEHPDLMPELADHLSQSARIVATVHQARDRSEPAPSTNQPNTDQALTATAIPGYLVEDEIGRGGQAVVYTAVQIATGRRVAIKFLGGGVSTSRQERQRIDREVEILAALHHPHIVKIIDRGILPDGARYVVTDYILGESLSRYVGHRPELREDVGQGELLKLFLKIAQAVAAAHDVNVVHRDLKPSNILVDEYGEPHLLDFGLARRVMKLPVAEETIVTTAGQFVGSLPWASPEQAGGGDGEITPRSDVYSLGIIFYNALTGDFPYDVAGSLPELLTNIQTAKARPLTQAMAELRSTAPFRDNSPFDNNANVVAALDAVLQKMLAKEPGERYENAAEVVAEIERVIEGRQTLAYIHTPYRRRYAEAISFAIFLVMGVSVAGVSYMLPSASYSPAGISMLPVSSRDIPPDAVTFRGRSYQMMEGAFTFEQANTLAKQRGGRL